VNLSGVHSRPSSLKCHKNGDDKDGKRDTPATAAHPLVHPVHPEFELTATQALCACLRGEQGETNTEFDGFHRFDHS
jgi:hypothetical protein